jgi:hypothetical protein
MPWSAVAAAVAPTVINSLFGGGAEQGYSNQAQQQQAAGQAAAEAQRFRPVGVTTRFGSSNFQMSPEGYLTGAGYTLTPEMQAYQNRLMGLTGNALTQAEQAQQQYQPLSTAATGLFGLGQQYLAQSPQEVAAKYMQQQQDLLAPSRERSMAQLQNQLFQQGRGGLSVGATGTRPSGAAGLGATTPEMEAYYNAMAQQDAQLAANAQQAGQQNVNYGIGLLGSGSNLLSQYQTGQVGALAPFQGYLGATQGIEQLGQAPLTLGAGLGGQSAAYGAQAGRSLLEGGMAAAQSNLAAARNSPSSLLQSGLSGLASNQQLTSGIGNWISNYNLNQNLQNAVPQGVAFNPMSGSNLDALISGNNWF